MSFVFQGLAVLFFSVAVVVVVLVVAFSYCRKLWPPDVGLCFQVCTGTLTLHNCRSRSLHASVGGSVLGFRTIPFRSVSVSRFVSWHCDRSVPRAEGPTRFPKQVYLVLGSMI